MSQVVIIGAGASGIIAALKASENNNVILVDSNDRCGKKILLTGNGRCNYWNSDININNYWSDNKDNLEKILTKENINTVLNYLDSLGIYPRIKNGYYYPYSNQATSIREIFERSLKKSNIICKTNFKVQDIKNKNDKFIIISENNENIEADKVVIATGSKAYPKTGSDGSGYILAKKLGHTINNITPALTPLILEGKFFKDWENIRCDVKVSLYIDKKLEKEEIGEIQLTKNGISGICTFNISGIASKNLDLNKEVEVAINFLPYLNNNFYNWFDERNKNIPNKTMEEQLESIFNYKLMFILFKKADIDKNKKWFELTEEEKRNLCNVVENLRLKVIGTEDFNRAQVCTGGLSLYEINPITMESTKVSNLYFIGEILDVDGKCGGFNLAFAFITGYLAGRGMLC